MFRKIPARYIIYLFFLLLGSCANIFSDLAQKDTDNAKVFEIKNKIDNSNWTGAINDIAALNTDLKARRDIIVLKASAYAGRCGLDVLTVLNNMATSGGASLFIILMKAFPYASTNSVNDCIAAQDALNTIGSETVRTVDENLLMAFVSFAKIGSILNRDADTDHDNVVDSSYEGTRCGISNGTLGEIGYSIALASLSLTSAGTSIPVAVLPPRTSIARNRMELPPGTGCLAAILDPPAAFAERRVRTLIGRSPSPGRGATARIGGAGRSVECAAGG